MVGNIFSVNESERKTAKKNKKRLKVTDVANNLALTLFYTVQCEQINTIRKLLCLYFFLLLKL